MNEKQEQNEKRKFPGLIYSFAGKVERYTKLIADAVALAEGITDEDMKKYLVNVANHINKVLQVELEKENNG